MPSNPKGRGLLPVNAAQTKKPFKQTPRPPAPRLRLIVRRLPPGLTEAEFWECLGNEWRLGQGKIDWAGYKPGKVSKDLAKPSRPARAYVKVKEAGLLEPLSAHIRATNFSDAKNSGRDPCLVGPPALEFAPYSKIPNPRIRHDGRQGTIDQDPEFIDFLQSLTEPITKPAANDDATDKAEKITSTPLVQYIKEKKANKAKEKEAAAAKAAAKKVTDGKDPKTASPAKPDQSQVVKKSATTDAEKARVAKATQQAVDSIKRSVAEIKGQTASPKAEQQSSIKIPTTPTQSIPKKERQRGDASAAARIIGRDLGLTPKEGRTPRSQRSVTTPAASVTSPSSTTQVPPNKPTAPPATTPLQTSQAAPSTPIQPPTGPRNLRNNPAPASSARPTATAQPAKPAKSLPQPSPGAKSAFLKHANPSQGITEDLLRSTFSIHGSITRCEIDKKKGLAYVDFTDTEGLRKAMAASPVKIANGSVVVLENKSPYKKTVQAVSQQQTVVSPKASIPSSPQVAQALPASTTGQALPNSPILPVTADAKVENQSEAIPETVSAGIMAQSLTQDIPTPSSPGPAADQPPSAPRGAGRGGNRGYRGRGFRGRGGPVRGGNRTVSTPASASGFGGNAPAGAPTEPKS